MQGARIIPALAGNTRPCPHKLTRLRDHPRSRGEYGSVELATGYFQGSSPLSRGIQTIEDLLDTNARIIPALAGNTRLYWELSGDNPDHPRSRGEYIQFEPFQYPGLGSSPLSRGILYLQLREGMDARIIPALAGNTLADKGFYQPDLSDLGNPLLARLRFSKSLAPRLRRPPSWRGESSGSSPEGPGRTIRVSPS